MKEATRVSPPWGQDYNRSIFDCPHNLVRKGITGQPQGGGALPRLKFSNRSLRF